MGDGRQTTGDGPRRRRWRRQRRRRSVHGRRRTADSRTAAGGWWTADGDSLHWSGAAYNCTTTFDPNNAGTPQDIAATYNSNVDCVRLLLEAGAALEVDAGVDQMSALEIAEQNRYSEVAALLRERAAELQPGRGRHDEV